MNLITMITAKTIITSQSPRPLCSNMGNTTSQPDSSGEDDKLGPTPATRSEAAVSPNHTEATAIATCPKTDPIWPMTSFAPTLGKLSLYNIMQVTISDKVSNSSGSPGS